MTQGPSVFWSGINLIKHSLYISCNSYVVHSEAVDNSFQCAAVVWSLKQHGI